MYANTAMFGTSVAATQHSQMSFPALQKFQVNTSVPLYVYLEVEEIKQEGMRKKVRYFPHLTPFGCKICIHGALWSQASCTLNTFQNLMKPLTKILYNLPIIK